MNSDTFMLLFYIFCVLVMNVIVLIVILSKINSREEKMKGQQH